MQCEIYRSSKKSGMYLYVNEKDEFSRVPDSLLKILGRLEYVMRLELTQERTLAQADPGEVRRNLEDKGFFLQLPPTACTEI
ncbi:MAG: YcgL domain-containing protein [Acidiferrobacterales bacterium]